MTKRKKVIVVLGTTASGKTKLAVRLAQKFKGEIISADSRQVYRGMDIGTGKDLKEYGKIKCHLIDLASPKQQFNVARWQKMAQQKIKEIIKRGKAPIVCGGTGLYIDALVEGFIFKKTKKHLPAMLRIAKQAGENKKTREKLSKLSLSKLLVLLKKIDPATYKIIDRKNRRRVERALEIYYQTGQRKSAQIIKQKPPYDFLLLGMTFPREVLKKRIDQRLLARLKEGMINEVKKLHRQGVSWKKLEEFGLEYRYLAWYLRGKISQEATVEELKKAISRFAKRQMTWFKRNKNIVWLKNQKDATRKASQFLRD